MSEARRAGGLRRCGERVLPMGPLDAATVPTGLRQGNCVMNSRVLIIGIAALVLAATGCSDDDDGVSAEEKYCEAGQSLESNVDTLSGLIGVEDPGQIMDLVVESSGDLESAVDAVEADLEALRDAANEAAADEVDALQEAMVGLNDAVSDLGDDLAVDNALATQESAQAAVTAAQAVYDTLSSCP